MPEPTAAKDRDALPIGWCHVPATHEPHAYKYGDADYWCKGSPGPAAANKHRKLGVTAEFPKAGKVLIGTEDAAIRLVVIDHASDGTIYFEVQAARGHFPGKGTSGRTQCINGMIVPGEAT